MDVLNISYRFTFPTGKTHTIDLAIDASTLELRASINQPLPAWAALDFNQCPHCPLDIKNHPHCPVALHIAGLVATGNKLVSHDRVHVEVDLPDRSVSTDTTAQRALSSVLGLMLAVSGCPHTDYFKPMARFHLPFANEEETIYRAASMYLLAQYFRRHQGGETDFDLNGLVEIYENIQVLNHAMATRLKSAAETDAAVNAVVLLDLFAKALPHSITDSLQDIRYLFPMYLDDDRSKIR